MNETIKQKIKKLLALSNSPNENEAVLALEKARQLMDKYDFSENEILIEKIIEKSTINIPYWQLILSSAVSWLNGTVASHIISYKSIKRRKGEIWFYGYENDVFITREMYNYLVRTINRMAKKNIRKNAKKSYINSYKEGIAIYLCNKIYADGEKYSWSNKRLDKIEFVEEHVKKLHSGFREVKAAKDKSKRNQRALIRDQEDAKSINLHRQTTSAPLKKLEAIYNNT